MKRIETLWVVAHSHAYGLDTILFDNRGDAEAMFDDIEANKAQEDNEQVTLEGKRINRYNDILMTLDNFIDYFTSDEAERERMKDCARDYLEQDEYLNDTEE